MDKVGGLLAGDVVELVTTNKQTLINVLSMLPLDLGILSRQGGRYSLPLKTLFEGALCSLVRRRSAYQQQEVDHGDAVRIQQLGGKSVDDNV